MAGGLNGGLERIERDGVSYEPSGASSSTRDGIRLQVTLFLLTVYTTTAVGTQMALGMQFALSPETIPPNFDLWLAFITPKYLIHGLPFSATILSILVIHEMGHYIASCRWRVRPTLPYFIPFPPPSPIGTLGAVIKIKSRIPNRRALMDIGAAGPLAGFVISLAALGVGLHLSEVVPVSMFADGGMSFGNSILSAWMADLIIGQLPAGYAIYDHPIFVAGWAGLFVTALNLIPVGQFDGGHIVYAMFGRRHELISKGTILMIGLFWALGPPNDWMSASNILSAWINSRWHGWLFWIFLIMILGRWHPPPSDPHLELDWPRKVVGYVSLAIFVLCFIPRPISLISP